MVARKTSETPTNIWKFSARLVPTQENVDLVAGLVGLCTRYYNRRVALHAEHVERYRRIREEGATHLLDLRTLVESAQEKCDQLTAERDRLRSERAPKDEQRAAREALSVAVAERKKASEREKVARLAVEEGLKAAREELKKRVAASGAVTHAARRVKKEARDEMRASGQWPELWVALDTEEERYVDAVNEARRTEQSGLPPGCYLAVDDAVERAIEDARPALPEPKWDRSNQLSVELKGETWLDVVTGTSPKFKLRPHRDPSKTEKMRTQRGQQTRMALAMVRVGCDPDVYVEATVRLHREPPPDTKIARAWLLLWREGGRFKCELQVALESPTFSTSPRPAGVGHVTVTPCCVVAENGISVALWEGSDGARGEITLTTQKFGPRKRGEQKSILARLTYHEAWASALDSAHATALEVLDPDGYTRGFHDLTEAGTRPAEAKSWPARRGLERLLFAWCRDRFGEEFLRHTWRQWIIERKARGLHLLDRPGPSAQLNGWWPEATAKWFRGGVPEATDQDVLGWWCYTWAMQCRHLGQERARLRQRVVQQRDAIYKREAIRLSTRYETVTVVAPRIASEKGKKSEIEEELRKVLHLVGIARCAEIVLETFKTRSKKRREGELLADIGLALRDVLNRAAVESGQLRRGHRRRPECERSSNAQDTGSARRSGKSDKTRDLDATQGGG